MNKIFIVLRSTWDEESNPIDVFIAAKSTAFAASSLIDELTAKTGLDYFIREIDL